jgi:dipeptidyl aminopeptidase/acylaminoacyl peptidase
MGFFGDRVVRFSPIVTTMNDFMRTRKGMVPFVLRIALATFACSMATAFAQEQRASIPVADFFKQGIFIEAVMSPSGRHVAATAKGGPANRRGLVVFDVDDQSRSKGIAYFANADVVAVRWVNDDRIVFELFDFSETAVNQGVRPVYVIDREGKSEPRNLQHYALHSVLNDGSDDVVFSRFISLPWGKNPSTGLNRVNTKDGTTKNITFGGPDGVRYWALDWRGNPRVAMTYVDGKSRLLWRRKAGSDWAMASEWNTYANFHESPFPIAVDDNNRVYMIARDANAGESSDTNILYVIDMDRDPDDWKALVALKGYDFTGSLILGEGGRLLGIHHTTDAYSTTWLDAGMKSVQAAVDKLLSTTNNIVSCGLCKQRKKVLVKSWSDRQPMVTSIFDTETNKIQVLGRARPWIKPQDMARREFTRYAARDGLSIPVHVTHPVGENRPRPAVIWVHGGPFMRGGDWRWDAETQFLASRGHVVIEPEFRGSMGFGYKHFRAGWKQWGLAMQDDIADAALWAVMRGLADPKRICVGGGSYGGYAALMGVVRHPDLYRCAIAIAAVADIDLMVDARWSDLPFAYREYGMPVLVADQDKDAAQIRDTSPLRQAARIKVPVLLAHGGEDFRVPIQHAYRMRSVLEKAKVPHEWIEYKDEGHRWLLEETNIDFWTRAAAFLEKNLAVKP